MTTTPQDPVLIIGGSGIVGSLAARMLRQAQPELPITIGGRDLAKAEAVARAIGKADAATINLDRPDLGLPEERRHSALVVFVKDAGLNALRHAQAHGIPHLSVSSGVFEVGPEMALHVHKPQAAPILMASHWLAGVAVLPTLHYARDFARVDSIAIGVVLDEQDMGGPAAYADFERLTTAAPHALILKDGKWLWAKGEDGARRFVNVDGTELPGQAYSPLDVISLAAATQARDIRVDLHYGASAGRQRGGTFSSDLVIEIAGEGPDGKPLRQRREITHPQGQAPITALGVTVGTERLLGLTGEPPAAPGLYLPEALIEPAYFIKRLEGIGTQFRQA